MEASYLERLDQNLGLQRLLDRLIGGDVQKITILSSELTPLVTRSVGKNNSEESLNTLTDTDRGIVCDCILEKLPLGRLDASGYHVAAPILTADGSLGGAVLVTISTKISVWRYLETVSCWAHCRLCDWHPRYSGRSLARSFYCNACWARGCHSRGNRIRRLNE